jgi:S-adenosylmethionine hydrolase
MLPESGSNALSAGSEQHQAGGPDRPVITLTTDFGVGSPYVAAMKGVILSINPVATIVDISHAIGHQDIWDGAWTLADVCERFPAGTIHIAVVDPGVGTARKIVYARIGSQQYVAPDNGLLSRLALRTRPSTIIAITEPAWWLPEVSATFHGRDIMAPVAARLSLGLAPERLGSPQDQLVQLAWAEVRILPGKIEGTVSSIDSFGNLITDITSAMLEGVPRDESVRLEVDEHETLGIYKTYDDQPPMTFMAVIGSTGHLELAIVGESAAAMLGIRKGIRVKITW